MALSVATIEAAIEAIETGGQTFSVDGMTFTNASLPTLYDMLRRERSATLRTGGTRPLFRGFGFSSMGYGESTQDNGSPTPVINS